MFTGIVEEVGRVSRIEQRGENRRITVSATNAPKELADWEQRICERSLLDGA